MAHGRRAGFGPPRWPVVPTALLHSKLDSVTCFSVTYFHLRNSWKYILN